MVAEADAGQSLVDLVRARLALDGGALLEAGAVFVDRVRASPADAQRPMPAGARLEVEDAPDAPFDDFAVLHEDEDLAFVVKPAGVSSTGDLKGSAGTLLAACLRRFGEAHLAGRLDRQASGVVLVLKTARARRAVPALRRAGRVERTYVVLSDRPPDPPEGVVTAPIGPDPTRPGRMTLGDRGARAAETRYASAAVGPGAVIHARPRTGRTHQVRVHLASVGAPVLGDRLYDGAARLTLADGRVVPVDRLALHCEEIRLPHPGSGRSIAGRSPPPPDFEALRSMLSSALPPPAPPRGRRRPRG